MAKQKPNKGFNFQPYMFIFGLFGLALTAGILYRVKSSDKHLISISVIALIAGVIFESKRITEKWSTVLFAALGSFIFSFVGFLPGKREHDYNFDNHIVLWPYWFIFFFVIFFIVFHGDKIIPKLTEGITLFQSIAVVYWVIDYGFISTNSRLLTIAMIIGLFFSLYSTFHAFTNATLSRTSRLTLSIWSSTIMMLFAIDFIYRVYQNGQIEDATNLDEKFYIGIEYFLLGISSIYIAQNILMIMGFLPGKETFFNAQYFKDLKELKSSHIKKYSDKQVNISSSFFCLLFTGTVFFLNSRYQILPRHFIIWMTFIIFSLILMLYEYISRRKSYSRSPH